MIIFILLFYNNDEYKFNSRTRETFTILQKQKIQRRESQSKSNCKEIQKFILKLENAR